MKTITYTAQVSKSTHIELDRFLEQQRILWNMCLEQRILAYKRQGISLTSHDQCMELTELRKYDEFNQYKAECQRSVIFRIHKAFHSFFRRLKEGKNPGFPRFKGKNRKVRSFDITIPNIKRINNRYVLTVKGIGKFRFKIDDRFRKPKSARIVVTPLRVKVQLIIDTPECDYEDDRYPMGIDVGIKEQITLNGGYRYPKRVRDTKRIKKLQRKLSKAVRGSNNRRKKKILLSKEYQRVAERERNYLHRLTTNLIKSKSSKFFVEDLKIENLVKNHNLARSILEQQWCTFINLLTYKAEKAGGFVRKVNPRNTSQRCSICGSLPKEKISLKVRTYECFNCDLKLDRDVNAACNILQIGLTNLSGVQFITSVMIILKRVEKEDHIQVVNWINT